MVVSPELVDVAALGPNNALVILCRNGGLQLEAAQFLNKGANIWLSVKIQDITMRNLEGTIFQ